MSEERAPLRVKIVGGLLLFDGAMTLVSAIAPNDMTGSQIGASVAIGVFLSLTGAALLLDARWGWPPAVFTAAATLVLGVVTLGRTRVRTPEHPWPRVVEAAWVTARPLQGILRA